MKQLIASILASLVFPFSLAVASVSDITVLAESGDAEAQFSLAKMYEKGDGIGKDEVAAVQWYGKAADLGHVEAKFRLGRMYNGGRGIEKDYCRGLYYIQNAAEQGYVMAQYITGLMYVFGRCGAADPASGQRWLELAEANGGGEAAGSLGMCYMAGARYGFEQNHEKAIYWLKKEMTHEGDHFTLLLSAFMIADLYYRGDYGATQDYQQALNWFYISKKITENAKGKKIENSAVDKILENNMQISEAVERSFPDYMKAIAIAAADAWWQQNRHLLRKGVEL